MGQLGKLIAVLEVETQEVCTMLKLCASFVKQKLRLVWTTVGEGR